MLRILQNEHRDSEAYINSLNASIKDTEKRLNNIVSAIEDGVYNNSTQERMLVLENQLDMLKEELKGEEIRRKYELNLNDILHYINSFMGDVSDKDTRDRILDTLIDKIYIYDDEMVVTFTYSDDRRSYDYEEMQALIDSRQKVTDMMNGQVRTGAISQDTLESVVGDTKPNGARNKGEPYFFQ